jgi:hypothetical protein
MVPRVLEGKMVALYTLTESAGRQASEALAEAFPSVRIELTSDHVCTPRLKALAHEADLFVVATASAKHAATDCIQRHRAANLRTAYAAGRGATSTLRAVKVSIIGTRVDFAYRSLCAITMRMLDVDGREVHSEVKGAKAIDKRIFMRHGVRR